MQYREEYGRYLLRLDKGERVVEALENFIKEREIHGAYFMAIGALDSCELAFFDEKEEAYRNRGFDGGLEILSLQGNLSRLEDGSPKVHLHGTFGRDDFSVIGGHFNEGLVSVTLEAYVVPTTEIKRVEPFGPFTLWDLHA